MDDRQAQRLDPQDDGPVLVGGHRIKTACRRIGGGRKGEACARSLLVPGPARQLGLEARLEIKEPVLQRGTPQ